jgi:LssY-like putative type I secretion system component LssY
MRLLKRLVQRLLIFGLGICCVWLIVFVVFETADRRLPWIMAVASTYGIAAYIILPRAIRLGLRIIQHKHVPSYTITGDGLPGDPVNIALLGTLQQLRAAFATVGWSEADRLSLASSWGMIRAFVLNTPPKAPGNTHAPYHQPVQQAGGRTRHAAPGRMVARVGRVIPAVRRCLLLFSQTRALLDAPGTSEKSRKQKSWLSSDLSHIGKEAIDGGTKLGRLVRQVMRCVKHLVC